MFWSHPRADGSAVFHFPASHHHEVSVTGSFNGWSQPGVPMARGEGGWFAEVPALGQGDGDGDVEYKLIADGQWLADPKNLTRKGAPGGGNSCWSSRGRGSAHALSFHSPALGRERDYAIHLPAGWATSGRRYPTLYLLHGALDGERAWIERGELQETIEALRANGSLGELIVVMPYEPGDLYRGDERVVRYLADDVVGHVDAEFPTLASGAHRAIDGLSTGGFTSLAMAASRPDRFGSVGSMSGSYNGPLAQLVHAYADAMKAAGQRHLVSCGHDEPIIASCRTMFERLERRGIDVTWRDVPGIHDWPVWRSLLGEHLAFHWKTIGPTAD
jgi:enterochelin esterase-like enzyme